MQLFLSWALNEACRIFNLVVQGRQGELKITLERGVGLQQKQQLLPLLNVVSRRWPLDQNGFGLSLPGQKCLKVLVLATI